MFSQRLVFPHSVVLVANSPGCLRVDGGGNMLSLCLEPASRLLDVNRLVTVPCDRCHTEQGPQGSARGEETAQAPAWGVEAFTAEGLCERA